MIDLIREARGSRSALVSATFCSLGIFLLAHGLERWRVVAFVHDTGAARSPVPYQETFIEWIRPVREAGLADRWFVVLSRASDLDAACAAVDAYGSPATGHPLGILVSDQQSGRPVPAACASSPSGLPLTPILYRSFSDLGSASRTVLGGGFALLDDRLAVRYASRSSAELHRLTDVLALYRASRLTNTQ